MNNDENGALPPGWVATTMGAVAEVVGGGTPKTKVPGNFSDEEGHPWLTPADLTGNTAKTISRGRRFLTDQGLTTSAAKYMPAGAILFSSRAPIGYVAIAANPITTNQGFRSFVPSEALDPNYAFHYLKSITALAEQLASGTTFNELSGSKAKTLPLPLPPIAEQRRIAAKLDDIEACTTSAKAQIDAAMQSVAGLRDAILSAACSGQLTADWRLSNPNTEPADSLLNRLSMTRREVLGRGAKIPVPVGATDLPELPSTWTWTSVDSLATAVVDGVHKTPQYVDEGVPFVTVRDLTAGPGISFEQTKFITPEDHRQFTRRTNPQRGDILISKDGTIGVTRAVRDDRDFSIFVSVALVKPVGYEMTDYLELAFQSPHVQHQMVGVGSGLVHLVLRDLKADGIPLPPAAEQQEIVRRATGVLDRVNQLSDQISRAAATLRQSSLAAQSRAFRGELVPTEASLADEENRDSEPAETLLAGTELSGHPGTGKRGRDGERRSVTT